MVPELDAKVDDFLSALATSKVGSPEFAAQAESVRTMGDADIRKAAETSNRMLDKPVTALKEGGLAEGLHGGQDATRTAPDRRGPGPGPVVH